MLRYVVVITYLVHLCSGGNLDPVFCERCSIPFEINVKNPREDDAIRLVTTADIRFTSKLPFPIMPLDVYRHRHVNAELYSPSCLIKLAPGQNFHIRAWINKGLPRVHAKYRGVAVTPFRKVGSDTQEEYLLTIMSLGKVPALVMLRSAVQSVLERLEELCTVIDD